MERRTTQERGGADARRSRVHAAAQDQLAAGARAAQWPSVSAFGDYVYVNPCPRIARLRIDHATGRDVARSAS